MSERRIRAAEWNAFASRLDARAQEMRANADRVGSKELIAVAVALMGVAADATAIAFEIRGGLPVSDDDDEGSSGGSPA